MSSSRRDEDALARKAARTEFDRPVVLRAGAGTGKTAALVSRVVAWCIGPGWEASKRSLSHANPTETRVARRTIGRVVAITFTEAAAAEMAERVTVALHAISKNQSVVGLPDEELPYGAPERAKLLLSTIDLLDVRTIHAWCRSLLSRYPVEAGIHPAFTLDPDGEMTARVVREVVESRLESILRSPNNMGLMYLFSSGVNPPDIEAAVSALVVNHHPLLEAFENPFSPCNLAPYCTELEQTIEGVLTVTDGLFAGVRAPNATKLFASLRELQSRLGDIETFADIPRAIEEAVPLNLRRHLVKAWAKGDAGKAESEAMATVTGVLRIRAEALALRMEEAAGLEPEVYCTVADIVFPMVSEVRGILRSKGILGFNDLLSLTHQLLRREGVASQVRESMDQLLVDEFQDTDREQCGIVRAIATRGTQHSRPGLFIVGDPKQSIYGWRNADLQAYEEFVDEIVSAGGKQYSLVLNFRSYGTILEEVDRCMSGLMVAETGLQPTYENLIAARGEGPPEPSVEAWVSNPWRSGEPDIGGSAVEARKVEASAIAAEAQRLMQAGEKLSEIGVLFRSMSDVVVYQKAMRDAGVPYEVTRDQQYFRRAEIIEAAALVRALTDPTDQIALVTLLRSSMVRVPDGALMALWCEAFPRIWLQVGKGDIADTDMECAINAAMRTLETALPSMSPPGWASHLKAVLHHVDFLRKARVFMSPSKWVHEVRTRFLPDVLGASGYQGVYRAANVEQFFRRLTRTLSENGGDWSSVNRSLRDSIEQQQDAEEARPSDSPESVQLLTIHKSKGLAFKHTFVVDMHHKIRGRERPSGTRYHPDYGLQIAGRWPPGFHRVWQRVERVSAAEGIRLLYVAMTRARDRLIFCGAWPRELRIGVPPRMALDYFGSRTPRMADPWVLRTQMGHETETCHDSIRWRFIGCDTYTEQAAVEREHKHVPAMRDVPKTRQDWAALAQQRPWSLAPSAGKTPVSSGKGGLPKMDALRVGIAIHSLIEQFDTSKSVAEELSVERLSLALHRAYGRSDIGVAAQRRARHLLETFRSGVLLERLLRNEILGREVPMLLDGGVDGPVAGWVGSIDLIYRNLDTGKVVVADFKTDALGEANREEAAVNHLEQGGVYVKAVQTAMGLDETPTFEVWFIEADECVELRITH